MQLSDSLLLQDQRHLDAAEGWLGLGDHLAALEELDQITLALKNHPLVLEVRYKIHSAAKNWPGALEVAQAMAKLLPDNPWGPFHSAYALHELKRTQEAYDLLRPAVEKFPALWLIGFNLACYSCRLGNLPEAMSWLGQAIDLAGKKNIRTLALDDEDLEPLWARIKEF